MKITFLYVKKFKTLGSNFFRDTPSYIFFISKYQYRWNLCVSHAENIVRANPFTKIQKLSGTKRLEEKCKFTFFSEKL